MAEDFKGKAHYIAALKLGASKSAYTEEGATRTIALLKAALRDGISLPHQAFAYRTMGHKYASLHDLQAAYLSYKQALTIQNTLTISDKEEEIHWHLACDMMGEAAASIGSKLNDANAHIRLYSEVIDLTDHPRAHLRIGVAYEQINDKEQAYRHWRYILDHEDKLKNYMSYQHARELALKHLESAEKPDVAKQATAKRLCVNPDCAKEIADTARFCGYCGTRQESQPKRDEPEGVKPTDSGTDGTPFIKDVGSGLQEKEQVLKTDTNEIPKVEEESTEKSAQAIFYADDFEVVRQFEPVIIPTTEEMAFEHLLSRFQDFAQKKDYPLAIDKREQRWRTEGGKGKQRIVIQSTLGTKWQRILFPIAVEQMGNDTTLKLSVLRKNEMAEFYYSMCDQIALASPSRFEVDYQINWRDDKKYGPRITQTIALFAELWEVAVSQLEIAGYERYYRKRLERLTRKNQISDDIKKIKTELAKAKQYTAQVNEEIRAAREDLSPLDKKKGIVITCAITAFIVTVGWSWVIALVLAGSIMGQWVFARQSKEKAIDDLRQGKLKNAQEQESGIQSLLSQQKLELTNIDAAIDEDKRRLISAVSEAQYHAFQEAEQNERKWREPSFVDEELEQLVFVVKNVFNQITAQLTGRKEVKDVKLQSTIGLGGMGFDE